MGSGWHTPSSACFFQCHSTAHPISNRADHEACLNQQNRSASQLHTKALRSLKRFYSLSWNWSDMLTKACLFANENMQSNFTNYQPTASVNSSQTRQHIHLPADLPTDCMHKTEPHCKQPIFAYVDRSTPDSNSWAITCASSLSC